MHISNTYCLGMRIGRSYVVRIVFTLEFYVFLRAISTLFYVAMFYVFLRLDLYVFYVAMFYVVLRGDVLRLSTHRCQAHELTLHA